MSETKRAVNEGGVIICSSLFFFFFYFRFINYNGKPFIIFLFLFREKRGRGRLSSILHQFEDWIKKEADTVFFFGASFTLYILIYIIPLLSSPCLV